MKVIVRDIVITTNNYTHSHNNRGHPTRNLVAFLIDEGSWVDWPKHKPERCLRHSGLLQLLVVSGEYVI